MNVTELKALVPVVMMLVLLALVIGAYLWACIPRLRAIIKHPEQRPWRRPPAQSLAQWIEIATRKLAPPARARIREEIEEHFTEAVEACRAGGLAEAEAQVTALADLGSADAAARRFGREHLTEKDAGELASLLNLLQPEGKARNWVRLLALAIIVIGAAAEFLSPADIWPPFKIVAMGSLLLVGDKMNRCIRDLSPQKRTPLVLRKMLLLKSFGWLSSAGVFCLIFSDQLARQYGVWDNAAGDFLFYGKIMVTVFLVSYPLTCAFKALTLARIRQKLTCASLEELDTPPQNPTAA